MARGVNPLFVGRSDIINILETALLSGPAARQKRFVISGMGGAGKSEVCLKFAAAYRQRFGHPMRDPSYRHRLTDTPFS